MEVSLVQKEVMRLLNERGVQIADIASLVFELQQNYLDISLEECRQNIDYVLSKREVQNALLTGIALDISAEKGLLPEPLLSIIRRDEPLYGVDEILALSITNVYGSIGLTNFGYLDKIKLGIIRELNEHKGKSVHTFLDDLVAGVVAAACARIAHSKAPH
ncbi:MAG: phosphatidylglycerophosphatase A [bacterium]